MKKELLAGLTDEQIAKLNSCNNADEILQLAEDEEITLTAEQLAAVNGGCGGNKDNDETKKKSDDDRGPNTNPF